MNTTTRNPSWWTREHDSAWERIEAAFRRDWEQTKHDFGGEGRDLNQTAGDTVRQVLGKEGIPPPSVPNYEEEAPAYRFGYGARRQYGDAHRDWDDQLESQLRHDWNATYREPEYQWERYRQAVRRGWEYTRPDDYLLGNPVPGVQTDERAAEPSAGRR